MAGGIALNIVETLYEHKAFGPQVTPDFWNKAVHRWIPFRPEELTLLYDELLEENGVTIKYGSRVVDAAMGEQAGRCVSCDINVQGALRVQPYCAVMGEAAGTALALPIHGSGGEIDVHPVNIETHQKTLLDGGSILD